MKAFKTTDGATATSFAIWSMEENAMIIAFYLLLAIEKISNGGKIRKEFYRDASGNLCRVTQGKRCADFMATLNAECGNNRGTRPDMKMQGISQMLAEIAPEFICPGFKPLENVQRDRRAIDRDAMLGKQLIAAVAMLRQQRRAATNV